MSDKRQHRGPHEDIAKLAHVAGPALGLELGERARFERERSSLPRDLGKDRRAESGHVGRSIAERRRASFGFRGT